VSYFIFTVDDDGDDAEDNYDDYAVMILVI